jgi:hypothetical protein
VTEHRFVIRAMTEERFQHFTAGRPTPPFAWSATGALGAGLVVALAVVGVVLFGFVH